MTIIHKVTAETVANLSAENKADSIKKKEMKVLQSKAVSDAGLRQDVVSISAQGKAAAGKAAEVNRYVGILKSLPDVDQDKINEVSRKVKEGVYFTKEVADQTAGKIMEAFQVGGD